MTHCFGRSGFSLLPLHRSCPSGTQPVVLASTPPFDPSGHTTRGSRLRRSAPCVGPLRVSASPYRPVASCAVLVREEDGDDVRESGRY